MKRRKYQQEISQQIQSQMDFKDIPGYNGFYACNSNGDVFSLDRKTVGSNGISIFFKGRKLKPEKLKGYLRVRLSLKNVQKNIFVHRLVAICFIENPLNKPCVNHKDGNKLNNNVSNLEWVSYSENERHSYDVLNKVNNNRKLKNSDVDYILNSSESGVFLSKKFNVTPKVISNVKRRIHYKS